MNTDNVAQNPYSLAQYIVTNPAKLKLFDFLDTSPSMERLPDQLFEHVKALISNRFLLKILIEKKHPNCILLKLAERADELCPGRTTSELLYKAVIVQRVHETVMKALQKLVELIAKPEIHIKIVTGDVELQAKQFEEIFENIMKTRSQSNP